METWPSGRRHFPAKEAFGLKPESRVRIPASPPEIQQTTAKFALKPLRNQTLRGFLLCEAEKLLPSSMTYGRRPPVVFTIRRIGKVRNRHHAVGFDISNFGDGVTVKIDSLKTLSIMILFLPFK